VKASIGYQTKSFRYAFYGLRFFFSKEIKSTIHLIAALVPIAAGIFLKISMLEWTIICFCIGLVFCVEIINTAIENLVDLYSTSRSKKMGKIKDLGAASVLIASCTAFAVALIIYLPKIIRLFY